jgi:hypothetical protein
VKITVGDSAYPFIHPTQASSSALLALNRESGLTFDDVNEGIQAFNAVGQDTSDPEKLTVAVLSDVRILLAFAALVFLAKWQAGERQSFEEACDVPFSTIGFVREPGDEEATPGPEGQGLPDSAPGGNRAARRASTPSRSRRSSAQSNSD